MAKGKKHSKSGGQAPQNAEAGQHLQSKKTWPKDKVCGKCGALLPEKTKACLVCGTLRGELPPAETFPVPRQETQHTGPIPLPVKQSARKSPDVWKRWNIGLSGLLLLMIVSLAGFGIYSQYFDTSSYRAGEVVVYESADGQLMLSYPGIDQPQRVSGVRREGKGYNAGELRASSNGRYIAYIGDKGGLYLVDLAQQRTPGSSVLSAAKVAEGVDDYVEFAQSSDHLVYLTQSKELYASNFSESWRLDSNVTEVVGLDQRRVLYTRHGDSINDDQVDLYLDDLSQSGGQWLLIDRDVAQVLDWTAGFEKLLYTCVRQNESGKDVTWLNSFEMRPEGNSSSQLVDGLGPVLDASAEKGTVVYLTMNTPLWDYESFIDDDMAEEDTLVPHPDLEEYPLLKEAIAIYGENGDFTDIADNEELVEQQRQYNEATVLWDEKQERDVLRMFYHNEFSRDTNYAELYDLYVWRNGQAVQLDSGIWLREDLSKADGRVNVDKYFVMYERIEPTSLKRMKVSDLWEQYELNSFQPGEYFFENTQRELLFTYLDGTPVRVYIRNGDLMPKQWRVAPAVDGIYFSIGKEENSTVDEFYFAPIKNGAVGAAVLAGKQYGDLGQAFRDGLLFHGPRNEGLFFFHNGVAQQLGDRNSLVASLENNGATLLYYKDCENDVGSLYVRQREEKLIAQGVTVDWKPWYRSDSLIYYAIPGKTADTVDLYAWQDGKTQLIQEEVRGVLRFPEL